MEDQQGEKRAREDAISDEQPAEKRPCEVTEQKDVGPSGLTRKERRAEALFCCNLVREAMISVQNVVDQSNKEEMIKQFAWTPFMWPYLPFDRMRECASHDNDFVSCGEPILEAVAGWLKQHECGDMANFPSLMGK